MLPRSYTRVVWLGCSCGYHWRCTTCCQWCRCPHMQCDRCCILDFIIANVCLVAQSYATLCESMDYSLPGSSVHGDSPGKDTGMGCHALFPRGSSQSRDQTQISHITGRFFTIWAMKKAHYCKQFLSLNLGGVIQKHWLDWTGLAWVMWLLWWLESGDRKQALLHCCRPCLLLSIIPWGDLP